MVSDWRVYDLFVDISGSLVGCKSLDSELRHLTLKAKPTVLASLMLSMTQREAKEIVAGRSLDEKSAERYINAALGFLFRGDREMRGRWFERNPVDSLRDVATYRFKQPTGLTWCLIRPSPRTADEPAGENQRRDGVTIGSDVRAEVHSFGAKARPYVRVWLPLVNLNLNDETVVTVDVSYGGLPVELEDPAIERALTEVIGDVDPVIDAFREPRHPLGAIRVPARGLVAGWVAGWPEATETDLGTEPRVAEVTVVFLDGTRTSRRLPVGAVIPSPTP